MDGSQRARSIVILSTKSSGSSALQRRITAITGARHVEHTRHFEYETLYWTKAASALGMQQVSLPDSEVPIPRDKARRDLRELLTANLPGYTPPDDDETMIYDGWARLCDRFRPVFLEKSPHHLHEWAAMELMAACEARCPNVDTLYIGLVRNPMDCLYSQWRRYYTLPEVMERHWRIAYENLRRFQERLGDLVLVVRYEDLTRGDEILGPVFDFIGRAREASPSADQTRIDRRSLAKWKQDRLFGFRLDPKVAALARSYAYDDEDLGNSSRLVWGPYRLLRRAAGVAFRAMVPLRRQIRIQRLLGRGQPTRSGG